MISLLKNSTCFIIAHRLSTIKTLIEFYILIKEGLSKKELTENNYCKKGDIIIYIPINLEKKEKRNTILENSWFLT